MEIITVDENLIAETSAFASNVFISYYDNITGHEQSVYMAERFLSQDAIRKLINEGAIFRLLMNDQEIIGFTEYKKETDRVFLSKLYVRADLRGKGYGRILFDDVLNYCRSENLNKIYLTVNKYNTPSYNIYLHLGFKVIDAVETDIGHGYIMDDYIMEYNI